MHHFDNYKLHKLKLYCEILFLNNYYFFNLKVLSKNNLFC